MSLKRSPSALSDDNNKASESTDQIKKPLTKKARKTANAAKWTEEEWKTLCQLKEKDLSWKEIADHFPGRTAHGVRLHYQGAIKVEKEVWTPEKLCQLREELEIYEKKKWITIGKKIGMTPVGCRKAVKDLNKSSC